MGVVIHNLLPSSRIFIPLVTCEAGEESFDNSKPTLILHQTKRAVFCFEHYFIPSHSSISRHLTRKKTQTNSKHSLLASRIFLCSLEVVRSNTVRVLFIIIPCRRFRKSALTLAYGLRKNNNSFQDLCVRVRVCVCACACVFPISQQITTTE